MSIAPRRKRRDTGESVKPTYEHKDESKEEQKGERIESPRGEEVCAKKKKEKEKQQRTKRKERKKGKETGLMCI